VTLSEGGTALAFGTLSGGSASFDVPHLLPGAHALVATYGGDGNFNPGTSNAASVTVTCQRTVSQTVGGDTSFGSGSTCVSAPRIGGNVSISPGARVFFNKTYIGGGVFAAKPSGTAGAAANIAMCGSQVNGQIQISATTSLVMLGDGRSCAGNTLWGPVSIDGTGGGVIVADNRVGGALSLTNNRPTTTVSNNRIGGIFGCSGNSAAPTNAGRPNTAPVKSGQCSGL
jgi:hexosaminidase